MCSSDLMVAIAIRVRRRRRTRIAIATMHYSMEDAAVQALLANPTVAIESGGGTKQSVVLKGLNHRYASVLAYVICARRDQRKRIVEMDNVRLFLAEYRSQIVNAVAGPGRSQPKFRFGEQIVLANFIVPAGELQDTVSGLDQHCFFRQELGVFASRLPVIVVTNQNFHWGLTSTPNAARLLFSATTAETLGPTWLAKSENAEWPSTSSEIKTPPARK